MDPQHRDKDVMTTLSGPRTAASSGAVVAAVLLAVGPTLAAGSAFAAPSNGPAVEFTGGSVLGAVVCKSQPSADKLSLPPDTRVMFINRLGAQGTLRVDGRNAASVGPNQGVPVVFHSGPVSVSMTYPCNLGVVQQYESVSVSVAPKAAAGRASASQANASSATSSAGVARSGSTRTPAGVQEGTPAEPANPGAADTEEPLLGADGFVPPPLAAGSDVPAADVGHPMPVAGTPRNGPSNLLALIAAVGVLGVAIAAIRAIVSQRTRRTHFA
jgi:hypothetical protein